MRPDDGTPEEMQAWNDRYVAEMFDGLSPTRAAGPAPEVPPSLAADATTKAPAALEETLGEAAILIDASDEQILADAIVELLNDETRRSKLGANGPNYALSGMIRCVG